MQPEIRSYASGLLDVGEPSQRGVRPAWLRTKPPVIERARAAERANDGALIADMEMLREHLRVERWALVGGSSGSTLAPAYAQRFPQRVTSLILGPVTETSRREIDWITCGVARIFPEAWDRFISHIPPALRGERIVDAYATLLIDERQEMCEAAAAEWCEFRLRFARFVTHYWCRDAFPTHDQLLTRCGKSK